jgi:hypothetical protein
MRIIPTAPSRSLPAMNAPDGTADVSASGESHSCHILSVLPEDFHYFHVPDSL